MLKTSLLFRAAAELRCCCVYARAFCRPAVAPGVSTTTSPPPAPTTPPSSTTTSTSPPPAAPAPWTPAAGDRVAINATEASLGTSGIKPGALGTVLCRLGAAFAVVCFDGLSTGLDLSHRCPATSAPAVAAAAGCQANGAWAVYATDLTQAPPACDPRRVGVLAGARVALAGRAVGGTSLNVTIPTAALGTVRRAGEQPPVLTIYPLTCAFLSSLTLFLHSSCAPIQRHLPRWSAGMASSPAGASRCQGVRYMMMPPQERTAAAESGATARSSCFDLSPRRRSCYDGVDQTALPCPPFGLWPVPCGSVALSAVPGPPPPPPAPPAGSAGSPAFAFPPSPPAAPAPAPPAPSPPQSLAACPSGGSRVALPAAVASIPYSRAGQRGTALCQVASAPPSAPSVAVCWDGFTFGLGYAAVTGSVR